MKKRFLSVLLLLLLGAALFAGEVPGLSTYVLDNGLEVFVLENHVVPLVTIQLTFRCGAIAQSRETAGLFHLYEHMLFKGNEIYRDQSDFKAAMKELGVGSWNGGTSTEYVTYYFTIPSEKMKKGIEFWANAVRYPLLDPEELEIEQEVVVNEIRGGHNDPDRIFNEATMKELFYQYPWRRDTGGSEEIVQGATAEDMRDIFETYYIPNNAALFVAGDVTSEEVLAAAREVFGDWAPAPDPWEETLVPHPFMEEDVFLSYPDPKMYPNFAYVQVLLRGPDVLDDPEPTYAADVWLKLLDNPTGRFKQAIFDRVPGLYHKDYIFASYYTQKDGGQIIFGTYMVIDPGKNTFHRAMDFRDAIIEEMTVISEDKSYFDEKDFTVLKAILEDETLIEIEVPSNFISTLSFWWASASTEYYLGYVDNMKKVEHGDIRDYLTTYVLDRPSIVSVRISPQDFREAASLEAGFEIITKESAFWWREF